MAFLSMLFFKVEECCCGCSVKDGSMIILVLDFIFKTCAFGLSVYLSIYMLDVDLCETHIAGDLWPRSFIIFEITNIIYFVGIIFALVGIYGMLKGNSDHVKVWLWYQIISTLLILIIFSVSAVFVAICNDASSSMYMALYLFMFVVMRYVCASLVHSHYLKMGEDTIQGFSLPALFLKRPWTAGEENHQQLDEEPEQ